MEKENKTESRLSIVIGIWLIALGVYSFVVLLTSLAREYYYGLVHAPAVFLIASVTLISGIWLTSWGGSQVQSEIVPKAERDSTESADAISYTKTKLDAPLTATFDKCDGE